MPIFELVRAIPVKSHLWKFGSDWLSLSRVIVVTVKKKIYINFSTSEITYQGGYIWLLMHTFELGWAIPVKSHVWKFGLDWLKLVVCKIPGGGGGVHKHPIRGMGHMWPAMPIFIHGRAISVGSLVSKFGSDWLSLSRVIVVTDKKRKIIIITDATENNTFGKILFRVVMEIKTSKASRLWSAQMGLTIIKRIWKSGNLPYLMANTYGSNFIKIGDIWFFGGQKPPIRGLTIIERSWYYGNLPYLVDITYGFNFIKNGGIWFFFLGGGRGQKSPIRRGLHLTCDYNFRTRLSYSSQKSCLKIWFGLVEIEGILIFGGGVWQKPPIKGVTCDWLAIPIFELGRVISVNNQVWKFDLGWLSLSRVIVVTDKKKKKIKIKIKIKQNHRHSSKQHTSEKWFSSRIIKQNHRSN